MAQHIIVAINIEPRQFQYFFGYGNDKDYCNILWTLSPWDACVFDDDDELATELELLTFFCPTYNLDSLRHA